MLIVMSYGANIDMDSSLSYRLMEGFIESFVYKIVNDRGHPRRVALSSMQKAAGLPMTSEGMLITRLMTESIMQKMVSRRVIEGYDIKPRKENGAEWVFVQLFKAGADAHAC